MKFKCIYLSGPMTGLPDFNRSAFNEAARALRAYGFPVINPAELNTADDGSWQACMRVCLKALPDADVLALLPGWESSNGAHLELHIAHRIGIQVMQIAEILEASEFVELVDRHLGRQPVQRKG